MKTWSKPSLAGRRLALQRKYELNVEHYGGNVSVLTVTAPGADVLPWGACEIEGPHRCSGDLGCRVEWIYATYYNATAQARMSRLFEAAQRSADRLIRRLHGGERLPRQIGNVGKVMQKRGVYHFHYGMPNGSEVERAWTRHVRRFMEQALKREASMAPERRWELLEREFATGEITRGVYGFGFSHPGRTGGSSVKAARYLARNAAGYLADNASDGARHYVSSRLTRESGVTMAALRGCNFMYVRQKLGEPMVPPWWNEDRAAAVLRVWALIELRRRGP